jgi:SAM-dependent methyltransferase
MDIDGGDDARTVPTNRWIAGAGARGAEYDKQWERLAAAGENVHGEADLVSSYGPSSVLDAGCGTGRIAIELARRGVVVAGVDIDPVMLAQAQAKAPALSWVQADLADPSFDLGRRFDLVVAAGNVMIFVAAGTEPAVVATFARHLVPGGLLVAGFQLKPTGLTLADYDRFTAAAGLDLLERFATWDRQPFAPGGDYAVSVHRLR